MSSEWTLALHGGAGTISRSDLTEARARELTDGLQNAAKAGETILASGGSSLDAVEATVRSLEDNPNFNAGRGAVLTADEAFELDAAVMTGQDLQAGTIMGVTTVANPVSLARRLMENTEFVSLAGQGAERFAREQGIGPVARSYFSTEFRIDQLRRAKAAQRVALDHSDDTEFKVGTVGAVARDIHGNLAAATSTGGMTNKKPGRIGDSPVIGAGTYADNQTCAVSTTGHGEFFLRKTVAYDIAARMKYLGQSLEEAANQVVMDDLNGFGGRGGLVAVAANGDPVLPFNTSGMYRATINARDGISVKIFK